MCSCKRTNAGEILTTFTSTHLQKFFNETNQTENKPTRVVSFNSPRKKRIVSLKPGYFCDDLAHKCKKQHVQMENPGTRCQ